MEFFIPLYEEYEPDEFQTSQSWHICPYITRIVLMKPPFDAVESVGVSWKSMEFIEMVFHRPGDWPILGLQLAIIDRTNECQLQRVNSNGKNYRILKVNNHEYVHEADKGVHAPMWVNEKYGN